MNQNEVQMNIANAFTSLNHLHIEQLRQQEVSEFLQELQRVLSHYSRSPISVDTLQMEPSGSMNMSWTLRLTFSLKNTD